MMIFFTIFILDSYTLLTALGFTGWHSCTTFTIWFRNVKARFQKVKVLAGTVDLLSNYLNQHILISTTRQSGIS